MFTLDIGVRVSEVGARDVNSSSFMTEDDQVERATRVIVEVKGARVGKVHRFLDESGSTVIPKLLDVLTPRLDSGDADGIVFGYGDRLARDWMDAGLFFGEMRKRDADVWDATDPHIDYRTPSGSRHWGFTMVMAEGPSKDAKVRGNSIADRLVYERKVPTLLSYGYRRNANALGEKTDPRLDDLGAVPDDVFDDDGNIVGGNAQVVRRIYKLRDGGLSWVKIAELLNAEGIPSPTGKFWGPSSVAAIIANVAYIGTLKTKNRTVEKAWKPLVPLALWNRMQSTKTVQRTGKNKAGIAGGLLVCETCKLPLSVTGSNYGYLSYGCRRLSAGTQCERPVYVSKTAADAYVERMIVELLDSGEGVDIVASAREIGRARMAADEATAQRKQIVKTAATWDPDDARVAYDEAKAREVAAIAHYDQLVSQAEDAEDFPRDGSAWRALDEERQRSVAKRIIDRVVVSPPLSRAPDADIEDRFDIFFVGAGKVSSARRKRAA